MAFSNDAQIVVAPTADRSAVLTALGVLQPRGGTAIGDALIAALQDADLATEAHDGQAARRPTPTTHLADTTVLLLSDGKSKRGVDPNDAMKTVADRGARVDTIALGTADGVAKITDAEGASQDVPAPPDPDMLRSIAAATRGRAFMAATADALHSIYASLGRTLSRSSRPMSIATWLIGASCALVVMMGAVSLRWFARVP